MGVDYIITIDHENDKVIIFKNDRAWRQMTTAEFRQWHSCAETMVNESGPEAIDL